MFEYWRLLTLFQLKYVWWYYRNGLGKRWKANEHLQPPELPNPSPADVQGMARVRSKNSTLGPLGNRMIDRQLQLHQVAVARCCLGPGSALHEVSGFWSPWTHLRWSQRERCWKSVFCDVAFVGQNHSLISPSKTPLSQVPGLHLQAARGFVENALQPQKLSGRNAASLFELSRR